MNIQRKYSLPNCTLLLEGLNDASRAAHFQEMRPELSILVNVECYISGYKKPLAGGREFFESLVKAVSTYAQEFLSHISHMQVHNLESEIVYIQKLSSNRHRLIVNAENAPQEMASNNGKTTEIDLNTVQLFDLVEAVDQFFADSQTLPELTLQLKPVARRRSSASEALLKQAVPASVGVTSLAAAAVAFSFIPAPQVRPPETTKQENNGSTNNVQNSASTTASPTPAPNEQITSTPTFTPTPTPTVGAVNPTPSPIVNANTPSAASPTAVRDLEALINTVPEITDASVLRALQRQVYNQINPAWVNRSQVNQDLVFRVGVAGDGTIVGYKAVNKDSNQVVEKTPLPNLLYNPADSRGSITNEPIAQYKVVFTNKGILEISPWRGYSQTPEVIGEKIADSSTINTLNQKLSDDIRQKWTTTASFPKELKYRVAVNKNGVIADYEPLNQVAFDYFRQTPLPRMFQEIYGSNVAAPNNKEPLAHFQVEFKPNGTIEVTPWRGYGQ
ncbi:MAG: DUF4335 domain-containing protein [Scytonema sp. PMC 1069.18]|nr:DUF4335 domain-containing protein [Scytonema sp. PMC 1069.18]MEC4883416.1 DUF4335 domain-containing protein [Scytonema sp. PMC 1070.18]